MLDTVRRYVEAGREALTPKKAEQMARALTKRLLATIQTEVKRQLARAGVATRDDIESLKRRIRKLESARPATTRRTAAPRKSSGQTTARRQSTTRRSG